MSRSSGQEPHGAEIGRDAIDARHAHFPGIARGAALRIGEIDRAVGFHDDIVRPAELFALICSGDDGDAAVRLETRDALRIGLAGDEPALHVARQPVRAVGVLAEHGNALPRRVFDPPCIVDVAEEKIAAVVLPPHRPFGLAAVATIAFGEHADGFRGGDDLVERGIHLIDVRLRGADWANAAQHRYSTRDRQAQSSPASAGARQNDPSWRVPPIVPAADYCFPARSKSRAGMLYPSG